MVEGNLTTKYAPAERANEEEVKRQIEIFKSNNVLNKFLSRIPAVFLIVNEYRQIVYMNKGALDFTGIDDITSIIGKRPGELIGCVHSNEEEGGCGTSESCTYCGAINAVLESQKGELAVRECRLIIGSEHHAFDLRVWAAPFKIDGEEYTAVTLQDIQNEKWRAFLERIFFHDILNTAGGLKGTLELLINYKEKVDAEKLMKRADKITEKLIEEIKSQQLLIIAENNLLKVSLEKFNSIEILNEML
ncbi:MAG: histidine kinase, partial [Candidatus Hermodarchaeota archaeon]